MMMMNIVVKITGIMKRILYRKTGKLLCVFIIAIFIYQISVFAHTMGKVPNGTAMGTLYRRTFKMSITKSKLVNKTRLVKQRKVLFLRNTTKERPHFTFLLRPWKTESTIRDRIACNKKTDARWSMVFVVKSAIKNSDRRAAIRKTWGSVKLYCDAMFEILFVLGGTSDPKVTGNVVKENQKFGDILQYNKEDIPKFVPEKVLAGMQWASDLPPDWLYSSIDDDVTVFFHNIYKYFNKLIKATFSNNKPRFWKLPIVCGYSYQSKDQPARNSTSKWYMPKKVYRKKFWPIYCRGGMYTTSSDMVKKLYEVSRRTPRLYLDDVWITGFMRLKVQNTDENIEAAPGSISKDYNFVYNKLSKDILVRHFWGNIDGVKVNVPKTHLETWKNSTSYFYDQIKCYIVPSYS